MSLNPRGATNQTTVSWSHIARRHKDESNILNVEADSLSQESQISLLQEALKCPQEIGSGARLCVDCGKRFHDVFRLAQHIKDKHSRGKVVDEEKQGPVLSDFVQFPRLDGTPVVKSVEKKAKGHGEKKYAPPSRHKKLSSLKKAYLKEKTAQLKESWSSVLASLDENIQSLEKLKEQVAEEKKVPSDENAATDWNTLQIVYQKEHIIDQKMASLKSMKDLCMQRLQHINKRDGVVSRGRNKVFFEQLIQDDGETTQDVEQTPREHVDEDEQTAGDVEHGGIHDVMYESDDDSISSDDSFELQWGDTLQNWAQNMGHMNLKHLSLADDGSRHDDAKPIVVARESRHAKRREEQESHGTGNTGAVRVISTYQKESNASMDSSEQTEIESPSPRDESPWTLGMDVPVEKPTSCVICNIPSLEPDEWEAHHKSESHRKRLFKVATRELHMNNAMNGVPLTKGGHLSTDPKKYTGPDANVEAYVSHIITDELNQKVSEFLSKLIAWQERSRRMDPMNAKKKKRVVCGMREAAKAVKLGKVKVLIVAPNVQPLSTNTADNSAPAYPVDSILQDCEKHGVLKLFALTRRKMGSLLGQRKSVSLFAVLNVNGAEDDLKAIESLLQNASPLK